MKPTPKSYFLKLAGREAGPYSGEHISQIFADGGVNRDTPCRLASGGDWKTIDDYLPILKYGTQLPHPSSPAVRSEDAPPYGGKNRPASYGDPFAPPPNRFALVDIDLPFVSILKLLFKWMAAGLIVPCCFIPVVFVAVAIVMATFGSLLGGVFGGLHHP